MTLHLREGESWDSVCHNYRLKGAFIGNLMHGDREYREKMQPLEHMKKGYSFCNGVRYNPIMLISNLAFPTPCHRP